jgi:hypothetical protein
MKELDRTVPMLYERNDSYVIEAFGQGEFDYLEGAGEVSEADFFRALTGRNILSKLADTYPSACKKHDVPVWVYIASDLSMRFHGVHPFHAFPYVGLVVTAGQDHEAPLLYRLVEAFVEHPGRGVMKRLILDRGFWDGAQIGRCKQEWGIHVLIPARQTMEIVQDVLGLAEAGELSFRPWVAPVSSSKPIPLHRPEWIQKREEARQRTLARKKAQAPPPDSPDPSKVRIRSEVAAVSRVETFSSCPIPLDVLVNREVYADGHVDYWVLLDTAPIREPAHTRQEYGLRTTIEERHRQLKCFSDLESFPSRAFSLVVHQVVFVLLAYSLLQWFLLRMGRKELNAKTRTRTLELLRPTLTVIIIYYQNYMAFLTPLQHQELVLTLRESARKKILAKTRRLRRSLAHALDHARPP